MIELEELTVAGSASVVAVATTCDSVTCAWVERAATISSSWSVVLMTLKTSWVVKSATSVVVSVDSSYFTEAITFKIAATSFTSFVNSFNSGPVAVTGTATTVASSCS